jgi:predicted nuclease with TOPRIM domain
MKEMKKNMEKRLIKLKKEMESGQRMFLELEQQKARLQEQLLRISGAIQVLEETLGEAEEEPESNTQTLKCAHANA